MKTNNLFPPNIITTQKKEKKIRTLQVNPTEFLESRSHTYRKLFQNFAKEASESKGKHLGVRFRNG